MRSAGRLASDTFPEGPRRDGPGRPPNGSLPMCAQGEGTAPPGGTGLRRKALRKVQKSLAGRYYRLLSGHAAIGSFLHDRMTRPQRLESDECWWCNCGKQQTRHHLFTECRAWAPQIRRL